MLINLSNIDKIYKMGLTEIRAIDGVSMEVEPSEYIAIMGPSGSGKSTLMNLMGCLDTPTSGSYILNDMEVAHLDDDKLAEIRNKEIGFVFQTFNLLPRANALQNVELPLIYSNISARERRKRTLQALEVVGLKDRVSHKPSELSGGERQRVAIARALVNSPSLLLADEPTGNLDSKMGEEIMQVFDRLHEEKNTIIVVTHEEHIARHAKRVIRLLDGKIISDERQE
ncbi:MAG: ABC transporter ATP-binding protein [Candidatus Aminicenantes bacterium]|nr:ABC transporter ATP-binding protein [Candidatus Aminicenantes bacterium]MDH5715497.1 ABC transporter ATP-binding protein [Candidatus Aminicenantes bacterium]